MRRVTNRPELFRDILSKLATHGLDNVDLGRVAFQLGEIMKGSAEFVVDLFEPCSSRTGLPNSDEIFCIHLNARTLNGIVDAEICRACIVRGKPSPGRRPVPVKTMSVPPEMPSPARQVWSAVKAAGQFLADGLALTTEEQYQARLTICENCDRLHSGRCSECGCFVNVKARGRTFQCPLNKWPKIE